MVERGKKSAPTHLPHPAVSTPPLLARAHPPLAEPPSSS
jgi:hypothetical protein